MQYNDTIIRYDQSNVNYAGMWSTTINETASFSESFSSIIRAIWSEIISMVDTCPLFNRYDDSVLQYDEATATYENFINADASLKKIGVVLLEVATMSESFIRRSGILKKLRGMVGVIKEFVRIGNKKDKPIISIIGNKKDKPIISKK